MQQNRVLASAFFSQKGQHVRRSSDSRRSSCDSKEQRSAKSTHKAKSIEQSFNSTQPLSTISWKSKFPEMLSNKENEERSHNKRNGHIEKDGERNSLLLRIGKYEQMESHIDALVTQNRRLQHKLSKTEDEGTFHRRSA